MVPACRVCLHLILFLTLLTACSQTVLSPTPPSPTSPPPQPTDAEPAANQDSLLFKPGLKYTDAADDMTVSFLDVVGFQAAVDEASESAEIMLQMRDVPSTATRGQVKNFVEYLWMIYVYLDASKPDPSKLGGDYYFGLNTDIGDPSAERNAPIPGTPVSVPIGELFENKSIYDSRGRPVATPEVIADPDSDTLTIRGRVPGITSRAGFSFSMVYEEGPTDKPDNHFVPSAPGNTDNRATPLPATPIAANHVDTTLTSAGTVRAYPGPEHYAGDVLSFEIQTDNGFEEPFTVSMRLDDRVEVKAVPATYSYYGFVLLPLALDTRTLTGQHTVKFTTSDGLINETYSFEVLQSDQRPANEENAAWMTTETPCCTFHYISETAAARDINFITDNFQQGATEFEGVVGASIPSKIEVYLVDRIWGNGGFGGGGQLFICYTDRYYGPTVGAEGLQTLARHEFTHAANVGMDDSGDGVDFDNEGLAVYIAGGHYKPEPLAQRGAALLDLGHYVPAEEFIPQHELSYLHSALIPTYIVTTYGEAKLWEFLRADANTPDEHLMPLPDAIQATFGISMDEFNDGFKAWLEKNEPGEQLEDLRLTIELQDLRREYQERYSPPPVLLLGVVPEEVARPAYLPMAIREAHAPTNIAIELLIANAQRAIVATAYPEAEQLIQTIKSVVSTGEFEDPLGKEYLDIVLAVAKAGYEVVYLSLQNGRATAQVTKEPPATTVVELQKVDGRWQINP